jgi:NADH:ubiquinone oxidoreductase subunit 2 (subunit N)
VFNLSYVVIFLFVYTVYNAWLNYGKPTDSTDSTDSIESINSTNLTDSTKSTDSTNSNNIVKILLPFIPYTSVDLFISFFTVEYIMLFFIFCLLAYGTVKHVSTDSVLLPKIHVFSLLIVICTFFLCVFMLSSHTYFLQSNLLDTSYIVHDDYNLIVECFILFIGFLIFFFTYGYNKIMGVLSFEYYVIMLSCLCSFCVFVHANNLIFIYVLIELQSIASYILTSMNKHNRYSIEAGLKYFIIGSFSSILLLFGFSFVYGFSGFIYLSDLTSYVRYLYSIDDDFFLYCLLFSLILVNIGFLFKIYASPFHF